MPRHAVTRRFSSFAVVALCAALAAACGQKREVRPVIDGGSKPAPDAAIEEDASVTPPADDAGGPQRPPWSWDDLPNIDPQGEYCWLSVAAECDGPEDCSRTGGGAGACCARIDPSTFIYTSIECADACDFRQTFPLCHAGLPCTADGTTVCRTSVLLPDDFIGVCAVPLPTRGPPTGEAVPGQIDCGDESCVVGAEQCCLRKGFDASKGQSVAHEPYCAPAGAPCDCEDQSDPPDDAGGGVIEDDAG